MIIKNKSQTYFLFSRTYMIPKTISLTLKYFNNSILITDVTHPLNNVLYSQDVAPRMGFVIPLTLQIMVVD